MIKKIEQKINLLSFSDEIQKLKTSLTFLFVIGVIFFIFFETYGILFENKNYNIAIFSSFIIFLSITIYFFKTKNINFGTWSIVIFSFLFEFIILIFISTYGYIALFVYPIVSIFLLGIKKGGILSFLLICLVFLLSKIPFYFGLKYSISNYFFVRLFAAYIFITLIIILLKAIENKSKKDYLLLHKKSETYLQKIETFNNQLKTSHNEMMVKQMALEEISQEYNDSTDYAKIIQQKLMPNENVMQSLLNNYFLIFKPYSKISGDFYYVNKIGDVLIFGVGDCTGHGIPGALLSVLSITLLHDIVQRKEAQSPSYILELMRDRFKSIMTYFGKKDLHGLDLCLCAIDSKTNKLQYSGANIPLYISRKNEIVFYDAVKSPIGYYFSDLSYFDNEISLQNNDILFISSDGFYDQLGGENRKRITKKGFINLLKEFSVFSFDQQKELLETHFNHWKGESRQLDDVTVLAVKWNYSIS